MGLGKLTEIPVNYCTRIWEVSQRPGGSQRWFSESEPASHKEVYDFTIFFLNNFALVENRPLPMRVQLYETV